MSIFDPKQDAAALEPVLESCKQKLIEAGGALIDKATADLGDLADGLTVTVTITVKKKGS